jgi:DNA-binding IscR family transcriptional regulator
MLDYDTLFAIAMIQTLGRSQRPMSIAEVTASLHGQVLLQQLRDAGLVHIYIESLCCELKLALQEISLLDVLRALHTRIEINFNEKGGKMTDLVSLYGEAGFQLENIRKVSLNILQGINLFDVWLVATHEQKEELEKEIS